MSTLVQINSHTEENDDKILADRINKNSQQYINFDNFAISSCQMCPFWQENVGWAVLVN